MALLFRGNEQPGDSNLDAIGAGKLYIYDNGTTNLASIYSDAALAVAITNPVTLNAAGRTNTNVFVIDNTPYTIKLDNASAAEQWSYDDTYGIRTGDGLSKYKTADQTDNGTSNSTLAGDDHLIGYVLEASSYYSIEGFLSTDSAASSTPDIKFTLLPDNAFQDSLWQCVGVTTSTTVVADSNLTTNAMIVSLIASNPSSIHIHGFIKTHATLSATVDLQWAQNTSDAAVVTLALGSHLSFRKMS